ncbi:tungstate ABC transporter substrate-binding protein WtpA [Candidatus Bathyarchaeota archaeon]|nr:tungstate ABC transporter substrate-binding protein WtpA [Candidatus Bathyarchaeota archaeon]
MKRQSIIFVTVLIAALAITSYLFYPKPTGKSKLKIYCAGSLLYPLERLAVDYMATNPNVELEIEGHGSIQVIRHVTELEDNVDILMVADYSLIPLMMYNTTVKETDEKYSNWYIRFSGNNIVLAYTNQSKYSSEINSDNWYNILNRNDVKIGIANPQIDALGYRSIITLQLAEYYYNKSSIFENLFGNNFEPIFESVKLPNSTVIFVPETQTPLNNKVSLRASSIQIVPLLQTGAVDYCFLYSSNAKQYDLNYLELPDEINLGNPQMDTIYNSVEVRFLHYRFGTISLDREGKTIYYGLTIPSNAKNIIEAKKFIIYLLEGNGKTLFDSLWHPIYHPSYTDKIDNIPNELVNFVISEP